MKAARDAGALAKGGHQTNRVFKKPSSKTLADQGIDKNLADRARKAATKRSEKNPDLVHVAPPQRHRGQVDNFRALALGFASQCLQQALHLLADFSLERDRREFGVQDARLTSARSLRTTPPAHAQ